MKKPIYYVLILFVAISLFGCSKIETDKNGDVIQGMTEDDFQDITATPIPTAVPTVTEVAEDTGHEGEMRSTLSGLWVSTKIGTNRPYAFQFNNFKTVRNQWGIGQADIVYECLVEGGITRLLGIGENYSGDKIGSTRSARHYFVSIADEYDAIYIHFGRTKYAVAKMKELGIDHMDGMDGVGSTVFYRDNSINAPHNAFASLDGIIAGIKQKGFETKHDEDYEAHFSFYEEDTKLEAGTAVKKLSVHFSDYNDPYFEYNSTDKLYYRFQFNEKHKDSLTGDQLAFKNIIIQFVKEWDIDKNGYQTMDIIDASGKGYYISNGAKINITWKKKEASSWMRYYNEAGEELTINPGKTYIALFPRDRTDDIIIK
ncbi:MAG: DUF3048 domain-containing protein [Mobilitalea sp.]